ncbi:hypothetical protein ACFL22_01015 [Patescibacteria group bacterium]
MNINSIKKILSKREKDSFKISLNPWRDWSIVVAVFTAAVIFVIAYMVMFFLRTNDDSAIFVIEEKEQQIEEQCLIF